MSLSADAISKACARLSSTHGPAINASGSALPKRTFATATTGLGLTGIGFMTGTMTIRRVRVNARNDGLYQPALLHRRLDEGGEQRMRRERPRFQLGMELHADEPGMVVVFDDLRQ